MKKQSLLLQYSRHLKSQKSLIILGVIAMIVVAISEGIIPKLVKDLLDNGFKANSDVITKSYNAWYNDPPVQIPAVIFLVACVRSVGQFLSHFALSKAKSAVISQLQQNLFKHILHARMPNLSHLQSSSLIHTLMFELQQAYDYLLDAIIISIRDSITLLVLLGYLCYLNWQLTGITLAILPILAILIKKLKQRLKQLNQQHHHYLQQSAYQIQQIFNSVDVVKAYQTEAHELNLFKKLSQNLKQFAIKIATTTALNQPITQIIASLALCIVIGIAMTQASSGSQSVGSFTSFIMAMLLLISPLKRLSDLNQPLTRANLAFEHVDKLLQLPQENLENLENLEINQTHSINQTNQTQNFNQLHLQNLSIAYTKLEGEPVLAVKPINIELNFGQKIAFVGSSGSGKSSVIKALLGLVDYGGEILLNAQKVKHIRHISAYVGQDTHLFARSVLDNITYGLNKNNQNNQNNEINIQTYLSAVNLQDWAQTHGLHNTIGDNGATLSGGQRQRLAIARSLYANKPLLLLDEATSGLDALNQEQISQHIQQLKCSVIAVAHRLQTVMHFDCIYVMHEGQMIASGTHSYLLSNNAYYKALWQQQ